jgi:cysteine desulfurase
MKLLFLKKKGTENVLEIVGLGKAAELVKNELDKRYKHMKELRDYLYHGLKDSIDSIKKVHLISDLNNCLPNTLNISFDGIMSYDLIELIKNDVAFSIGLLFYFNIRFCVSFKS